MIRDGKFPPLAKVLDRLLAQRPMSPEIAQLAFLLGTGAPGDDARIGAAYRFLEEGAAAEALAIVEGLEEQVYRADLQRIRFLAGQGGAGQGRTLVLATTLEAAGADPWADACREALESLRRADAGVILLNLHPPGEGQGLPGWREVALAGTGTRLSGWEGPWRPRIRETLASAAEVATRCGAESFGYVLPGSRVNPECLLAMRTLAENGLDAMAISRTLVAGPGGDGPWLRQDLRSTGLLAFDARWWKTGGPIIQDYLLAGGHWQAGVLGSLLVQARFHHAIQRRGALLALRGDEEDPADGFNMALQDLQDPAHATFLNRFHLRVERFIAMHQCLPNVRQAMALQEEDALRPFRPWPGTNRWSS
jgi:hypothetical protein